LNPSIASSTVSSLNAIPAGGSPVDAAGAPGDAAGPAWGPEAALTSTTTLFLSLTLQSGNRACGPFRRPSRSMGAPSRRDLLVGVADSGGLGRGAGRRDIARGAQRERSCEREEERGRGPHAGGVIIQNLSLAFSWPHLGHLQSSVPSGAVKRRSHRMQ